jgi:hypothetical protein
MKKKSKNKSRFKKLPKRWSGGLTYYDQNSQLFTQQEGNQFSSLAANTQYNNPNSFQNSGGIGQNNGIIGEGNSTLPGVVENQNYSGAMFQVGNYLGSAVENIDNADNDPSMGGSIASGALSGAGAGAALGSIVPGIGTAVGGVVGGVVGGAVGGISNWIEGNKAEEEVEKKQAEIKNAKNKARLNEINQNVQTYKPLYKRGGKLKKYPIGGSTSKYDSTLTANKNVPFVNRIIKGDTSSVQIPGELGRSTHFMESSDKYVYPKVQKINGKLVYTGDSSRRVALKNGNYIKFPTEKEAIDFGENYKNSNIWKNYESKGKFAYGDTIPKYAYDPNKLEPLGPKMFEEEHDGYVHGKSGLQPYYKSRDIRVPGFQRPVMGYIDSPDNSRGSDKVYSGEFTPLGSTNTNKAAYGEPRLLTRNSAILRTAEILGEPVEKVKEVPDLYFKRLIDQSDGYFKRGVSGTNQETLQEIIPTKRYESEDFDKIKFKKFGGQLKNTFNRTPNIVNYKGQTHNGPDEGIPVDEEGNPSVVSGKEPIALTENGEVTWNGYVFSDKLY